MRVGLISDTHGLLRPQALAALDGCDHLIHAGDIGSVAVLRALVALAPMTAVRGNNDVGADYQAIPEHVFLTLAGVRILVVHDVKQAPALLTDEQADVVVSGHSHKPLIEHRDGRLYVNPGSAGPRRFRLPITLADLHLGPSGLDARIRPLAI